MRRHLRLISVLVTLIVPGFASSPGAQPTRVMIGAAPASNQSWRVRMTQESDIRLQPSDPDAGDALAMKGSIAIVMRQRVGERDAAGRLRIDVVYEEMSQSMTMDGVRLPDPFEALKGVELTMWIDRAFEVVEVSAPKDFPVPDAELKSLLGQMMAAIPHRQMTVGEVVATPIAMPMPIPMASVPAGRNVLEGETRTTLVRVVADGDEHVASLDQSLRGSFDAVVGVDDAKLRVRLTMSGSGATETEIRSGRIRRSLMTSKVEGRLDPTGGSEAPAMKISGTSTQRVERLPWSRARNSRAAPVPSSTRGPIHGFQDSADLVAHPGAAVAAPGRFAARPVCSNTRRAPTRVIRAIRVIRG